VHLLDLPLFFENMDSATKLKAPQLKVPKVIRLTVTEANLMTF
jgi:hypothetical protein